MDKAGLEWMISVDDHILEPATVWQERLPKKHREAGPRLVRDTKGEAWAYEGSRFPTVGLSVVAGKRAEEFSPLPITYDEMRPGCYDPVARLADMEMAGVVASLCFPSFAGFCGERFLLGKDRALGLACIEAYNDWLIEDWCGAAPGRYIPMVLIPLWSPAQAAREIERCAAKGARAVSFSESPQTLGLPTIQNPGRHWEPMLATAADAELVVCMHPGTGGRVPKTSEESTLMVTLSWAAGGLMSGTLLDWLFSGVFLRQPKLKIALSEAGIGWIPYFLERAEQVYRKQRYWAARSDVTIDIATGEIVVNEAKHSPDEFDVRRLFREHVSSCFIDDWHGIRTVDEIGVENVLIESDYPHSDSTWPHCLELAKKQVAALPPEDQFKILQGNARRLFRFEPAFPG